MIFSDYVDHIAVAIREMAQVVLENNLFTLGQLAHFERILVALEGRRLRALIAGNQHLALGWCRVHFFGR